VRAYYAALTRALAIAYDRHVLRAGARYETLFTLATGGMGRVDLARSRVERFERLLAIKRVLPWMRDDPSVRSMFLEEARLAGGVRHANVVSVLDVGEDDDGPFLVMDYVEGLSLAEICREPRALPIQLALRLGAQLAAGLHAAHDLVDAEGRRLELVHRDVSPHNVLIGFDGVVRLTDFGIARALGSSTATRAGVLKGKMSYMAPEQLRCEPLDRRTDVFALGIVLYEIVAGQHPFGDDPESRAHAVLAGETPDLGDHLEGAPPDLVELLFEMLAPDRALRPATAEIVGHRLEAMIADRMVIEGPIALASFMEEVHGARRLEARERVRAAIETATAAATPATSGATSRPRGPLRRVALAAAIGVALGGIAAVAAWRSEGTTSEEVPTSVVAEGAGEEVEAAPGDPLAAGDAGTLRLSTAEEHPAEPATATSEARARVRRARQLGRPTADRGSRGDRPPLMSW
jgi:hypothetical protein